MYVDCAASSLWRSGFPPLHPPTPKSPRPSPRSSRCSCARGSRLRGEQRRSEVVDLLSLLDVPFNEAGANEVTSRNLGSELLHELLRALSPAPGAAAPALAAYFGHDTNLQFLRRMLKLNWLSEGWWPNLAEPGSLLVFELYEEPGGSESVRLLKVAATPRQQRRAEPLTTEAPPSVVPLWIPGCRGLFCPMSQFAALAGAAIRRECVEEAAEGGSAGAEFRHPEDSAPLRGMQAAAAGLASASALAEPLGTVHAESAPAGPGAPPAAAAGRAPGEVRAEQAGGALPGGASAAPPRGPAAAAPEGAAEGERDGEAAGQAVRTAPSARGPTAPAAAQAAPETPLEPQRDGGGGGGFSLVLVLAVAGFFGWRYWKQQAASRGYESIGGTGGRSRGTTASERIIGSRSAGAAMPGFTL
ncbi:unnamed protein product [Prorocentrum cordatum]|uniref:Testicular acid phosphatase n=1 Tax=Prorocentrum cordatum TaxID=2364126 RepID=A0ABN9SN98_9DINO|nr:unnamed protein product [Polarella glacialis]